MDPTSMPAGEWVDRLPVGYNRPRYDSIVAVFGHSKILLSKKLYINLGVDVITGLLGSPGQGCMYHTDYMKEAFVRLFSRDNPHIDAGGYCLFGEQPEVVLNRVTEYLKHPLKHIDTPEANALKRTNGILSTNSKWVYNRVWKFDKPNSGSPNYGCVLLITKDEDGVHIENLYEDEIRDGIQKGAENKDFRITKETLLTDIFSKKPHLHAPFVLDFGCSDTTDNIRGIPFVNPITVEEFIANGIFGGKKKSKRKSYRSKKTIKITQR